MMDLRQGILATAQSLGIDPVDLGTAISYETAGTFDPTKRGPTTQWGQHRGLIQFGEPQAKQYGVDWNDPIGSQLGENGAVAQYLRGAGVKPGMGMMDIYSAINAGSVGRYGASDANNGGAPGTVADKVNGQMAGHREKAMALLGNVSGGGGNTMIAGNPQQDTMKPEGWLTQDRKDALIVGLEGMTMNPNEALVGMAGGRIADRRAEAKSSAAKSKTTEWLRSIGRDDLANAVESGSVDGSTAAGVALTPQEAKGRDTVVVGDNLVDRATGEVVFTPAAQDPSSTVAWLKAQGREDLASGVQSGAIPASEAVKNALNPPSNGITITNPDGTTTQIGGRVGGGVKPTEGTMAANAYKSRMEKAEAVIAPLESAGKGAIPIVKGMFVGTALEGFGLNSTEQSIVQARRDWIRAKLRKESGAVIGAEEEDNEYRTYFPLPGEGPEIIAQKQRSRAAAIEQMNIMGGAEPGAITTTPLPPADGVIRRKFNPETGMIE